ncbi:MAG: thiol-disulfide oxidoreductase DCC family protein [Bacteroidota bacterium]
MTNTETYILLFDGVCNLCNRTVQFTIKNDPRAKFKFASLQSDSGQALLQQFNLPTDRFDSLVLIKGNNYFVKSSAVLRILKELRGAWKLGYFFIILPRPFRDFFYNLIAKSRYRIFGKRETCMIPSPEINKRFLP